jgi:hypothetical protein
MSQATDLRNRSYQGLLRERKTGFEPATLTLAR